jgi:hypothetical protein
MLFPVVAEEEDCSSREMCKSLADKMSKMKDPITIPLECKQYPEIMVDLRRKNSKETAPSAFVGCHAGLVRQAQLTRRMTAGKSGLPKETR